MLGKLLKYEFKATYPFMLLVYSVLLTLSLLLSVAIRFNADDFVETLSEKYHLGSLLISTAIALLVLMFVVMTVVVLSGMFFYSIKRFKDNLLGNEGYLMHTLPVKTRNHIFAKGITAVTWTIVSSIVVFLSYVILISIIGDAQFFKSLFEIFSMIDIKELLTFENTMYLIEFFVTWIVSTALTYLHIYASLAMGYSSNTHRAAKSVGVFILLSIAASNIEAFITFPLIFTEDMHTMMWVGILVSVLEAVIFYMITEYFLKKRLNLQ